MVEDDSSNSRKVRFHSRVQFKTIRHVANFSDDEIRDGWYNKKDFMRMSDEVSEIAKLVANGQTVYEGEELCTRGLEHLVEEDVADYRAEKMIESIDAVLDEQDEQIDENIYDPYTIAEVYGDIVTPLLREAYLVGLRDAKEGAAAAAAIPDIRDDYMTTSTSNNRPAAAAPPPSSLSKKKTTANKDSSKWVSGSNQSGDNSVKAPRRRKSNNSSIADLTGQLEDLDPTDRDTSNSEDLVADDDDDDDEDISDVEISDTDHDDEEDGEENLNSSLHSMSNHEQQQKAVRSTKTIINEPDKKKIDMKKNKAKEKEDLRKKLLASKDGKAEVVESKSPPTSPTRKNRRKAIDRKAGTELSPFVIQRDGKIKFRNYDEDQKKREQSRQRKESIKSSLFSMLDQEDDDAELAAFLATPSKKKPNKLYSVQSRTFFTKGGPKKKS